MKRIILILSLVISSTTFSTDNITNQVSVSNSSNVALSAAINLKRGPVRARKGNDVWGWTDPDTGREYAIMGLNSKTSFVDITNPAKPRHLVDIKTAS